MTTVTVGMNIESIGLIIINIMTIPAITIVRIITIITMIGITTVIMVDIVLTTAAGTTIKPR